MATQTTGLANWRNLDHALGADCLRIASYNIHRCIGCDRIEDVSRIHFQGGFILLASGILLVVILATAHRRRAAVVEPFTFSRAVHPGARTPVALNGFGLWIALMIGLSVVNYGYPIAQLAVLEHASVPVIPVGSR